MSNQYAISAVDISVITGALSTINSNINLVGNRVDSIGNEVDLINDKQTILSNELEIVKQLFLDYLNEFRKKNNLQIAETRLGNLRQDLQINFGYYSEIRRMSIGILQGADNKLVSNETIKFTTEEVLIKAPGYWLAPVLVAISCWLRDDKEMCNRAVKESLKRDDYKSTMFYLLLMRRLNRQESSLKWLERYFMHQDPRKLDREFILILEAVTTGIFLPASRTLMMEKVKSWLDELCKSDDFIEKQKMKWIEFFEPHKLLIDEGKYPLLSKYSPNWALLKLSLESCKGNKSINGFFQNIINNNNLTQNSILIQLDETLSRLVTNFDDEELPLRRKERLNELIIEKDGDKDWAEQVIKAEEDIFNEEVDLLQLLTNAAFNPESSGSTLATQKLAISISKPWILESFDSYNAKIRSNIPSEVELKIDGFVTSTKDGADEKEQLTKQSNYYTNLFNEEKEKIKFPFINIAFFAIIFLIGIALINKSLAVAVLLMVGAIILSIMTYNTFKKSFTVLSDMFTERSKNAREILRGCLAESYEYFQELKKEDLFAETTRETINSISPEDFSSISKGLSRNIIN